MDAGTEFVRHAGVDIDTSSAARVLQLCSDAPFTGSMVSEEPSAQFRSIQEIARTILHVGLRYLGLDTATLIEITTDSLVVVAQRSEQDELSVPALGLAERSTVAIHDARSSISRGAAKLRASGVVAYTGTPIHVHGHVAGILEFTGRERHEPFSTSDLDMVANLGRWIESELAQTPFTTESQGPPSYTVSRAPTLPTPVEVRFTRHSGTPTSVPGDSEEAELEPGNSCDVVNACGAAIDEVESYALAKGVRLSCEVDARADSVRVDKEHMKEMLGTLLRSSIQLAGEQGNAGLEVSLDETSATLSFAVWNDVDQNEIAPPRSAVRPRSQLTAGLSLVHALSALHGGTLAVESTPRSNRFLVTLPHRANLAPIG